MKKNTPLPECPPTGEPCSVVNQSGLLYASERKDLRKKLTQVIDTCPVVMIKEGGAVHFCGQCPGGRIVQVGSARPEGDDHHPGRYAQERA